MKVVVFPVLALLALSPTIPPPESPMVKAAQEFIASLSPEQRAKALFARNEQVANDRYEHLTRLVELYK